MRADTAASPTRAQGADTVILDGDAELFPDPTDRTAVRLGYLRTFLAEFAAARGRLPDRLGEAVPADTRPLIVSHDAWGRPFRYTRRGDEYDLRSAGPDGRFDTADDVVVTRAKGTRRG